MKSFWKEGSWEWSLYSCFFSCFQKLRSYRAVYKSACARTSPAHAFRARVSRRMSHAHISHGACVSRLKWTTLLLLFLNLKINYLRTYLELIRVRFWTKWFLFESTWSYRIYMNETDSIYTTKRWLHFFVFLTW